ncbi:MAG: NAD(P)-binding domain-containing protein [Candidatus Rokuibacteriota bacterium]
MDTIAPHSYPIAVIGAGPVGLAAAAHLVARGERPVIFEAGPAVGAHVAAWSHVQIFSPWRYNVDAVAAKLLRANGWAEPDPDILPIGAELIAQYLRPLADIPEIAPHIRLDSRIIRITRAGYDKMKTEGRERAPFTLRIRRADGLESNVLARAVIDASGTWGAPNPLGADGVPADGETAARDCIAYRIPAPLGADRRRYAGRRVLVVGSGHSAFNVLLDLVELAASAEPARITWAVRRSGIGQMYGGGAADALPARGQLGERLRAAVADGHVRLVTSFRIASVQRGPGGVSVTGADRVVLGPFDEIVAATGFRPDLSLTQELRLDLDPAVESPRILAPLIDPNVHSCGTVPPHGVEELRHPEPGFYTVGMKSYGRAPTFLMLTGYEQVRSVVAALVGDLEAARRVELTLPESGVCSSTAGRQGAPAAVGAASCCGSQPAVVSATLAALRRA